MKAIEGQLLNAKTKPNGWRFLCYLGDIGPKKPKKLEKASFAMLETLM